MPTVAKINITGPKGTVVVKGSSFTEVSSTDAKNLALAEARKHLGLCGISNISGPYPVDEQGDEITDPQDMVKYSAQGKPLIYNNEFTVAQSFGV